MSTEAQRHGGKKNGDWGLGTWISVRTKVRNPVGGPSSEGKKPCDAAGAPCPPGSKVHRRSRAPCSPGSEVHKSPGAPCSPGSKAHKSSGAPCSPGSELHRCSRAPCSRGSKLHRRSRSPCSPGSTVHKSPRAPCSRGSKPSGRDGAPLSRRNRPCDWGAAPCRGGHRVTFRRIPSGGRLVSRSRGRQRGDREGKIPRLSRVEQAPDRGLQIRQLVPDDVPEDPRVHPKPKSRDWIWEWRRKPDGRSFPRKLVFTR